MKTSREKADAQIARYAPCPEHGALTVDGYCDICSSIANDYERDRSDAAVRAKRCPVCLLLPHVRTKLGCPSCPACEAAGADTVSEAVSLRAVGYCPVCCGIASRAPEPHCHYCHTMHEEEEFHAEGRLGSMLGMACGGEEEAEVRRCIDCDAVVNAGSTHLRCTRCKVAREAARLAARGDIKGGKLFPCESCGRLCASRETGKCKLCNYVEKHEKRLPAAEKQLKGPRYTCKECGRDSSRQVCHMCERSRVRVCECGTKLAKGKKLCAPCVLKRAAERAEKNKQASRCMTCIDCGVVCTGTRCWKCQIRQARTKKIQEKNNAI